MEFKYNGTKEELNKEVHNLLKKVNYVYQVNIFENELRNLIDVKEEDYLFSLTVDYNWLMEEKQKDGYNDLASAIYEEYIETYLN